MYHCQTHIFSNLLYSRVCIDRQERGRKNTEIGPIPFNWQNPAKNTPQKSSPFFHRASTTMASASVALFWRFLMQGTWIRWAKKAGSSQPLPTSEQKNKLHRNPIHIVETGIQPVSAAPEPPHPLFVSQHHFLQPTRYAFHLAWTRAPPHSSPFSSVNAPKIGPWCCTSANR